MASNLKRAKKTIFTHGEEEIEPSSLTNTDLA